MVVLVHDYLEFWARAMPHVEAASDERRSVTFADLDDLSSRFAGALLAGGLTKGDRIGLIAKNRVEWLVAYYGSFKCGVVAVPVNYRLHPQEWAYILDDAGVRTVVTSGEYAQALDDIRAQLPTAKQFVSFDDDGPDGWIRWSDLLSATPRKAAVDQFDELYQMYTSGTTGRPKGAVLTHAAVTSNMAQSLTALQVRRGDRALIILPMYHAGAVMSCFTWLGVGASLVVRERFEPDEAVRLLDEDGISVAAFVPSMMQSMLVDVPGVADRAYTNLRSIAYGASPIAEETLRRAVEVFGCEFVQSYGMTESSAVMTMLLGEDHRRALAGEPLLLMSCGRPIAGTAIRVVDPEGRDVPPRTIGEIVSSGPQMMSCYWNMPEATDSALRDGWLHTGDAGWLDDHGYLYVSDRLKDMIVSGGENIYPREIEDVLFAMPDVADAAVIGVPDERWGEAVKAIVCVRAGCSLDEAAVTAACRQRLAGFKVPKSVDFVDSIPRNPSGKALKAELRTTYWSNQTRGVS